MLPGSCLIHATVTLVKSHLVFFLPRPCQTVTARDPEKTVRLVWWSISPAVFLIRTILGIFYIQECVPAFSAGRCDGGYPGLWCHSVLLPPQILWRYLQTRIPLVSPWSAAVSRYRSVAYPSPSRLCPTVVSGHSHPTHWEYPPHTHTLETEPTPHCEPRTVDSISNNSGNQPHSVQPRLVS